MYDATAGKEEHLQHLRGQLEKLREEEERRKKELEDEEERKRKELEEALERERRK